MQIHFMYGLVGRHGLSREINDAATSGDQMVSPNSALMFCIILLVFIEAQRIKEKNFVLFVSSW